MVTMRRKEVVAAMLPMQKHWLPLSNLDLLLPPLMLPCSSVIRSHVEVPAEVVTSHLGPWLGF